MIFSMQRISLATLFRLLMVGFFVFFAWGCSRIVPSVKPPPVSTKPPVSKKLPKPYKIAGKWYQPLSDSREFAQSGLASWYGKKFHGRKTANGETYNMYGLSAAHKTLPLGTFVRVHNLDNNRTLDVRVNDRGPFISGRIIDLSYGAAKKLRVVGPGTARVKIWALGSPSTIASSTSPEKNPVYQPLDYYSGNFTFQVGAFSEKANAHRMKQKLDPVFVNTHVTAYFHKDLGKLYAVRVGSVASLEKAKSFRETLKQKGFTDAFTVAE
jgi:rare lipoprotein A